MCLSHVSLVTRVFEAACKAMSPRGSHGSVRVSQVERGPRERRRPSGDRPGRVGRLLQRTQQRSRLVVHPLPRSQVARSIKKTSWWPRGTRHGHFFFVNSNSD
jgi:hypothetical protein